MSVVYDAGALVAADRGDRRCWAAHRARLEAGLVPVTTAPVVAQVSRSPRQAQLRRILRGCDVEPFAVADGHAVGELLARAGAADVVDGHVALVAARTGCAVLTSDPDDLSRLAEQLTPRPAVREV